MKAIRDAMGRRLTSPLLLRSSNLRRARGRMGRMHFDGPFPDRFIPAFDGNN